MPVVPEHVQAGELVGEGGPLPELPAVSDSVDPPLHSSPGLMWLEANRDLTRSPHDYLEFNVMAALHLRISGFRSHETPEVTVTHVALINDDGKTVVEFTPTLLPRDAEENLESAAVHVAISSLTAHIGTRWQEEHHEPSADPPPPLSKDP